MQKLRPNPVWLSITILFYFCIISGSSLPAGLHASKVSPDSVIRDLIFNARYDQAIAYVQKAIRQNTTDPNLNVLLLIRQSEIYLAKNNRELATGSLQEASLKRNELTGKNNRLDFLYSLDMALLLREKTKNADARAWLQKSLSFLNSLKVKEPMDVARLYCTLGIDYYETRNPNKAILYFDKSVNRLTENSLPEKTAKITCLSFLQMASLFLEKNKMASQAEAQADSIYLTIDNKNHPSLLTYYLNLSFIYLNYGLNLHKARDPLHLASEMIKINCASEDPKYGLLYYYEGQLAYQERDAEKALGYFKQAENYLLSNADLSPYMYLYYFDVANTYYFCNNNFTKAIDNYNKVIKANNKWLRRARINSMVLTGYCYLELKDTLKAIACIKNGIKAAESGSNVSGRELTYTYRCMAGLYLNIGKEKLAYQYFEKAYALAIKYAIEWDLTADIITNLGNYLRDLGEIHKAIDSYQLAFTLIDKDFSDSNLFVSIARNQFYDDVEFIDILNNKGYALLLLYEKEKNYRYLEDALKCQEIAIKIIQNRILNLDDESSEYNWIDLLQTTFNNAVSFAAKLYNLTNDVRYAEKGFEFSEKSRMISVLIASHYKKIKKYAGIPDSLLKKETVLHNEILNLQNQIYQNERAGNVSINQKMILRKLTGKQLEYDQLKLVFENHYKKYFDLKYNLEVISLYKIQERLDESQVILEYQLSEEELIILAITRNHFTIQSIPIQGSEKQSIIKFRKTVSENPSNKDPGDLYKEFTVTSHDLYSWLIKPVETEIRHKRLIIIPHNELNLVPFELLIDDIPTQGNSENYTSLPYLIRKFPISYAYSATLLFDETTLKPSRKAAFFIPDYSNDQDKYNAGTSNFSNLRGTREEVKTARKLLGGDLFIGDQANETNFKLVAGNYRILHIASHTNLDDQIPTLSSLVLTTVSDTNNDGLLHSYELYQLELNAQLIVLSGCNTGMGMLQQGEGLLSLSRSFFYSGTRSVALTLWPFPDKAGAQIIMGFYKGLNHGDRLEDALQTAKLSYITNADPAKCHPYYWGGFVIVGKTDPIASRKSFPGLTILLIFFTASIVGLAYCRFRN